MGANYFLIVLGAGILIALLLVAGRWRTGSAMTQKARTFGRNLIIGGSCLLVLLVIGAVVLLLFGAAGSLSIPF